MIQAPRHTKTTSDPMTSTENIQSRMYSPGSSVACAHDYNYNKSVP